MSLENSCRFKGNLTADPVLKHVGVNNTAVLNFTIIANRVYTKKNGEKNKESTPVYLEAWDSAAEYIANHFKKGDKIEVEATYRVESWEDSETGQRRSRSKFRVNEFDKLFRPPKKDNNE